MLAAALGLFSMSGVLTGRPLWLSFKPNRLLDGETYDAFAVTPAWAGALVALWAALALVGWMPGRWRLRFASAIATAALVAVLMSVGGGAAMLVVDAAPSARVSPMGGVWIALLAVWIAFFAALDEPGAGGGRRLLVIAPALVAAGAIIGLGALDALGLARELAVQGAGFLAEVIRHLSLAGTSLGIAAAIGVPLAVAAARNERVAAVALPGVGLLQTLPSLALFGLMLGPLAVLGRAVTVGAAVLFIVAGAAIAGSILLLAKRLDGSTGKPPAASGRGIGRTVIALKGVAAVVALGPLVLATVMLAVVLDAAVVAALTGDFAAIVPAAGWDAPLARIGVRGIGTAPALIALTLYALLPIVRNTWIAMREVPRAAIDAGRGMGMSEAQLLRRVELPLALPLVIEGLRASAVLTIGIATVAYLIGAGGLGVFIQRGIDQVVPDLILLGALPVIGLALSADALLRALGTALTPRGVRAAADGAVRG